MEIVIPPNEKPTALRPAFEARLITDENPISINQELHDHQCSKVAEAISAADGELYVTNYNYKLSTWTHTIFVGQPLLKSVVNELILLGYQIAYSYEGCRVNTTIIRW